jgi:hypothetical protein
MSNLVLVSFFATFFLALADNYFALKIGKLAVALVGSILGSALMYSGSVPHSVVLACASAFFAYILLELVKRILR